MMEARALSYDTTIECHGVKIPIDPHIVTDRLQRSMKRGRYEKSEAIALQKILRPEDKVLDLGSGVGLISAIAAKIVGPQNVVTIEANPEMMPMIKETHRINGVEGIKAIHGVGATELTGDAIDFHLHKNFWSSTMDNNSVNHPDFVRTCQVPEVDLNRIIADFEPTVMTADIEGGELSLFDGLETGTLRSIAVELHPRQYGPGGTAHILATLMDKRFVYDAGTSPGGSVISLRRFRRKAGSA